MALSKRIFYKKQIARDPFFMKYLGVAETLGCFAKWNSSAVVVFCPNISMRRAEQAKLGH